MESAINESKLNVVKVPGDIKTKEPDKMVGCKFKVDKKPNNEKDSVVSESKTSEDDDDEKKATDENVVKDSAASCE